MRFYYKLLEAIGCTYFHATVDNRIRQKVSSSAYNSYLTVLQMTRTLLKVDVENVADVNFHHFHLDIVTKRRMFLFRSELSFRRLGNRQT